MSAILSRLFSTSPRRTIVRTLDELLACNDLSADLSELTVNDEIHALNLIDCQRAERFLDSCQSPCSDFVRKSFAKCRLRLQMAVPDGRAPLWQFDSALNRWVTMDVAQILTNSAATPARRNVKLLTFNTWFDQFANNMRNDALVNVIATQSPDIVCLQEMTPRMLARLLAAESVRNQFSTTDCHSETFDAWYGTVTLIKRDLVLAGGAHFRLRTFPDSNQGRLALVAHVDSFDLDVCNVHLESMDSARERANQLTIVHAMLEHTASAAVVCGDFNLNTAPEPPENATMRRILHDFVDAWQHVHPDDAGITFDTDNAMMKGFVSFTCQSRIDRIMARNVALQSIEIVGRDVVGSVESGVVVGGTPLMRPVCVSDHFGLVAEFDVVNPSSVMKDAQE